MRYLLVFLTLGLYGFVGQDPVNFTDPTGTVSLALQECNLESAGSEADQLSGRKSIVRFIEGAWQATSRQLMCNPGLQIAPGLGMVQAGGIAGARITGYTWHGLQRAISREGVGVAPKAILDAVKNPLKVFGQSNGTVTYVGRDATVVLNEQGQLVTTWALNRAGMRIVPGARP